MSGRTLSGNPVLPTLCNAPYPDSEDFLVGGEGVIIIGDGRRRNITRVCVCSTTGCSMMYDCKVERGARQSVLASPRNPLHH